MTIANDPAAPDFAALPVTPADVAAAADRIAPHVVRTPVLACRSLDELCAANREPPRLALKCETFQKTGSFKARGAANAVLRLCEDRPEAARRGVVTHSSGNHGAALARAAGLAFGGAGVPCRVVMPANAPRVKRTATEHYLSKNRAGGAVVECGPSLADREAAARELEDAGFTSIHPSDDPHVIAGQGTCGLELMEQRPELDVILCPVGGGGLIAGTLLAVKHANPTVRVIGCEPAVCDDAARGFAAGWPDGVPLPATGAASVADGLRSRLGRWNLPILKALLNDMRTAEETEILAFTRHLMERAKLVVEPSAAVTLAVAATSPDLAGLDVGVIVCGGNVDVGALFEGEPEARASGVRPSLVSL